MLCVRGAPRASARRIIVARLVHELLRVGVWRVQRRIGGLLVGLELGALFIEFVIGLVRAALLQLRHAGRHAFNREAVLRHTPAAGNARVDPLHRDDVEAWTGLHRLVDLVGFGRAGDEMCDLR